MALTPGTTLGPYEIVSVIGVGGMGEVYRARERRLARDVAVKLLPASYAADADRLQRFSSEAHLLASLNHANIAHVYGLETASAGGAPALVMELVEGPTLAERMAAGCMEIEDALPVARQIAEALEYAHDLGIVHRDLKPANIKLRPDGTIKVLDFGLAKALDPAREAGSDAGATPTVPAQNTEAGMIVGTPAYMSPEQARGRAVDKRADIWAFGIVLFEMLAGRHPFSGHSSTDVLAAVVRDDPPWDALPVRTPPRVRQLLARMLERDPRQRLRDIGEARVLLDRGFEKGVPDIAPSVRAVPRATPRWPLVVAVAAVTAALVVAAVWLWPQAVRPAAPMRFTIPQPTSSAFNQQIVIGSLAVSPDGQHIASVTPEGLQLWSADTGTSRLLEDTGAAVAPFFSPDSQHLGFFARDELRRIATAGGPAHVVTAAPSANAGTWSTDDHILYTRWLGEELGLWHVPARGGVPRLVRRAAHLGELHAFPSFLPDARHYVFLKGAYALPVGQRQVCIAPIDGGDPVCVAEGDSNAFHSPTGHLVFVRRGDLVALPFDAVRRQATAAATTLARDVRWFGPVGIAVFGVSADGRVLVHAPIIRPRRLFWVDRAGRRLADVGEPRRYNQLQISPDGRHVAVDIWNAETGGRDLWTIDLASGDLSRVTNDPVDVYLGAWSHDGRSLIYAKPSNAPPDVYEISVQGGTPRALLERPGVQLPQHRTSSGWLAYLEVFADRDMQHVWLVPPAGAPRRLRPGPASTWDVRFSPDGRLLAFVTDESGVPEVYISAFAEQNPPRRVSRGGGFQPRWRADGRELFYLSTDGALMAVALAAERSEPVRLFGVAGATRSDAQAPPRERFTVYDVTGDGQKFLLRLAAESDESKDDLRVWVNWASALR